MFGGAASAAPLSIGGESVLAQRYRVAIRRHLGIPFASTAQAGRLFGWRFAIHVEDLEYKMSNMAPAEEQLITGNAMGSWQISGNPTIGDILTYNITDSNNIPAIHYTVTSNDLNPAANIVNPSEASPTFSIALNSSLAINNAAAQYGYSAVAAMPADLFSPQYMPPYFAEVILTAPGSSATPTISNSVTGTTNLLVEQPIEQSPVNAVINNIPTFGYVQLLDTLAMQIGQANLSLWLTKADVVSFRSNEVAARYQLYKTYCVMLSRDLGGKEYTDHFFDNKEGTFGVTA